MCRTYPILEPKYNIIDFVYNILLGHAFAHAKVSHSARTILNYITRVPWEGMPIK